MITTQVIDTAKGCPAAGIPVDLDYFISGHGWRLIGQALTDSEGVVQSFDEPAAEGIYRLSFDIAAYRNGSTPEAAMETEEQPELDPDVFFPSISITFVVRDGAASHHLPLFLSPYGYSTCRS